MSNQSDYNHRECDRFELLSAYLDGEVTAQERKQVQQWLETDPQTQQLYRRLLTLRHGFQCLTHPTPEIPPTEMSARVFQGIDQQRRKKLLWFSGGAIAATFIATISGIFPGSNSLIPRMAINQTDTHDSEQLMIALNEPAVEVLAEKLDNNMEVNGEALMLPLSQPPIVIPDTY